ncbi:MAG: DUF3667 domain-containing protein [Hyphomonadaceae bacterium]|nr:DUF3667 domain-containing protein [Hyphomonadaceae bacterium]
MSGEIEAAGAAVTAGLVANAIEGPQHVNLAGVRHGEGKCLNCDADVNGRYCANCGQPTHVHRTLGHVVEEFLHGLIHFDTKAWRTLPMLVARPGTLTSRYVHGRRAHYISPVATFLLTVFLMFFVFSVAGLNQAIDVRGTDLSQLSDTELLEAMAESESGEQRMRESAARMRAENTPGAAGMEAGADALAASREKMSQEAARRRGGTEATAKPEATLISISGWNTEALNARFRDKLKNPELLFYKVQQNAYKYSFLLVPISLPFVALLFLWKRGWTLYDHVVFTLYSLSFMSLLFITVALLSMLGDPADGWVALLVGVGVPAHMFFHLGGTYGLKWWSALWRTLFLLVFAITSLVIFLLLMIVFGVLS